jgi:DNA-binding NtrC family response regulator
MNRTQTPRVLVVDDEPPICRSIEKILAKLDVHTRSALNGYAALTLMETESFDVVITDLKMSSMGGLEVLSRVKQGNPDAVVVVMTGYASVASAVEVMKSGAFDYLPKPFTPEELRAVVRQALQESVRRKQHRVLKDTPASHKPLMHQLIGESPKIKTVISMVDKVAGTDSTVLICGESGTGKELIARAVHVNSPRRDRVFFAVDCGTLSGNLLESELFGFQKGAFTGADRDKEGIFSLAAGGTVFLDEISNTGPEVQGKLLRFLEQREFLPLGASAVRQADVRLIFATNQNLEDMVASGTFRQDFYYRIQVYPILLPPLRERREDILPIAYHFLRLYSQTLGKKIVGFDDDAARQLSAHDWPGNVRQLRNVVERAVILCEKNSITLKELQVSDEPDETNHLLERVPQTSHELKQLKKEIRTRSTAAVEKSFLLQALDKNAWNVSRSARQVGLLRSNFQALLKKHGITRRARGSKT